MSTYYDLAEAFSLIMKTRTFVCSSSNHSLVSTTRGLMLEGAVDGIKYYLHVDWNRSQQFGTWYMGNRILVHRLRDTGVWIDAAIQIFYRWSVSIAQPCL